MSEFLIDRETTELLKSRSRLVTLPDGETSWVKMFDVAWRWFDRLDESPIGMKHARLIELAMRFSKESGKSLDDSLGDVIEQALRDYERSGLDITETDADLQLLVAHRKMAARAKAKKAEG